MEETLRSHLFSSAADISAVFGLSEQAICQRALNDNRFLYHLRVSKRGFNVRTYDRIMGWMRETRATVPYNDNTPEALKLPPEDPEEIESPSPLSG